MTDKQYFKDYYNSHKATIIEKQTKYYYQSKLNIPEQYIDCYRKHKKVLKQFVKLDLDDDTVYFFKLYFKNQ